MVDPQQVHGEPEIPEVRRTWYLDNSGNDTYTQKLLTTDSDSGTGSALGLSNASRVLQFNIRSGILNDYVEMQNTDNDILVIADNDPVYVASTSSADISIPGFITAADPNGQHIIATFTTDGSDGQAPVLISGWAPTSQFMDAPFQDQPAGSTVSGYLMETTIFPPAGSPALGDLWFSNNSAFTSGKPTSDTNQIGKIVVDENLIRSTGFVFPPKHATTLTFQIIMPQGDQLMDFETVIFAPGISKRGFFPGFTALPLVIANLDNPAGYDIHAFSVFRMRVNQIDTGPVQSAVSLGWKMTPGSQ